MNSNASAQMKNHWARCRLIAPLLEITHTDANMHWSCCLKEAWGNATWAGAIPENITPILVRAYADCLLRAVNAERQIAERRSAQRHAEPKPKPRKPIDPPNLAGRIKIMLWAIETCGSVEKAEDALERAKRSLEDS